MALRSKSHIIPTLERCQKFSFLWTSCEVLAATLFPPFSSSSIFLFNCMSCQPNTFFLRQNRRFWRQQQLLDISGKGNPLNAYQSSAEWRYIYCAHVCQVDTSCMFNVVACFHTLCDFSHIKINWSTLHSAVCTAALSCIRHLRGLFLLFYHMSVWSGLSAVRFHACR